MTPAIRLNDTTDIGRRAAAIMKFPCGTTARQRRVEQARKMVDLGLYSVTFSSELPIEAADAEAYSAFRAEAAEHGMRHFLEVFDPAFDIGVKDDEWASSSTMSCAPSRRAPSRSPHFLKLQYNGPRAMEELAGYDPGR